MNTQKQTNEILKVAISGKRLTSDEAVTLFNEADIYQLGAAANEIRKQKFSKGQMTFIIDRNINYTNVCINQCGFCAFWRNSDVWRSVKCMSPIPKNECAVFFQ